MKKMVRIGSRLKQCGESNYGRHNEFEVWQRRDTKSQEYFSLMSPDGDNLFLPDFKFISNNSKKRGVDVRFSGNVMSFNYAIWDRYGSDWAMLIGQELAKHLNIEKAGWASIGWCDSIDEFNASKTSFIYDSFTKYIKFGLYQDGLLRKEAKRVVQEALDKLKGR